MTDAEIMKGVKLCNGDLGNCKECPFDSIGKTCGIELAKAEIGLIERLQAENAELRERLDKAVEIPDYVFECINGEVERIFTEYLTVGELKNLEANGYSLTKEAAEARLAELKGEKE